MRSVRVAMVGAFVLSAGLVAAACYPPSQTPTGQAIPPGGRVVATLPTLTHSVIEDATGDLSKILYAATPWELGAQNAPYRFWVYDDDTGTTTEIPVGGYWGAAAISRDGRQVAFLSNDASKQVGPVAANCVERPLWQPEIYHVCHEVYVFDLTTDAVRQLTGLDGSSSVDHMRVRFTDDGSALYVESMTTGSWNGLPIYRHSIDLATGVATEVPAEPPVERWDRGTHEVVWDAGTGRLTSVEVGTGEETTLWSDPLAFSLRKAIDDGRFVVLSAWINDQVEVFRLVDTDDGTITEIPSPWVSDGASHFAVLQQNVAPEGIDRLIIAPLQR